MRHGFCSPAPGAFRLIRCVAAAGLLAWLMLVLSAPVVMAQTVPSPLSPPGTTSPRASFENFLRNTDAFIALHRANAPVNEQNTVLRAAVESFDFDATPYAASISKQIERVLMTREILARAQMPAASTIPDAQAVAANDIAHWTVPGTELRMARIDGGGDAGAFRFDARTIVDLELDYHQVRDLPRRDGRADAFAEYLRDSDRSGATEDTIATRLGGVRMTSPRNTLEAFMANMNAAYAIAMAAQAAHDADPPAITREQARIAQAKADNHLRQASSVFDLSQVPAVLRRDTGIEAALLLKEVLDRMPLPRIDTIPNAVDLADLEPDQAYRWRLPGTAIEIERMQTGPDAGNFLFDANSVALLPANYEALKDLPYRAEESLALSDFHAAQVTPGFYEFYASTPGYLVPSAHILGEVVERLPEWLFIVISGQTLWQWAGLILTLGALAMACWGVFRVTDALARRFAWPPFAWLAISAPLVSAYFVRMAALFLDVDINFTGMALRYLLFAAGILELAFYVWAVWRLFRAIGTTILASPAMSGRGFDASLVRLLSGILAVATSVGVAAFGLQNLGVDIVPLLAGIGVGGLAVALAIRPTLENLIGGLILFSDKPVRVGDFCTFGGMSGTVEDVGIRSTQIRAMDRTLIAVPNAKFVDMEIINWARCDKMLISSVLGLRYETSDDQLRFVLVRIREMLHAHPRIDNDTIRVRFSDYGPSSLDISLRVYALTRDWNEFHAIKEDVFLRIKQIVEGSGTRFAIPSQTLYMTRDGGLDAERAAQADAEVARWRETGTLPFPRLTPARMRELEDTLAYPPEGSSEWAQARAREGQTAEPLSTPETDTAESGDRKA
ncbi:MAG: MscS family membrane protein [Saliniramus fredricksonii]|uniref:MscS family membrane protein n=1 Tax=Saliniramus fredricksonii TaxID=1653334 RepID=A0A0P7XQE4_9HYPH|nr:mechanosensitive ion channel family protein [Saliniramus fredricksonii]KPQ09779.1 MAG: MscS family membrane protein [Saliniramus fredricksonii]SCC80647.1 MscS family membrane protein [Saliniramus fredricksonii]